MDEKDKQMLLEVKETTVMILERLDNLSKQRDEDKKHMEELINLKNGQQDLRVEQLELRVKDLEDDKRWLWRTIAGIVISAILGLVIITNKF